MRTTGSREAYNWPESSWSLLSIVNFSQFLNATRQAWASFTLKEGVEELLRGKSDSGELVSADSAMRVATGYACVRLLSEALASLPITLYRVDGKGKRVADPEHKLYSVLVLKPNQFQTSFEWREMAAAHLILRGVHYSRIYRNGRGEVTALMPLHPDAVSVQLSSDGTRLIYTVNQYAGATPGTSLTLGMDEVLHIRGLHSDILTPITPVAYAANTLGLEQSMAKHQGRSFGPDAVRPGGVIETEGKVPEATAFRVMKMFNSQYAGANNAGKTLFLDRGMSFKPLALNNQDQQFLETRKFSVEEVCRIFNVPPSLVHHNYNSTYSNAEQQVLAFVKFSLRPLVIRFEESLSKALLSASEQKEVQIDFDMTDLQRGDAVATSTQYRNMVQGGIITPNEARERLGFDRSEQEGSDALYMQTAMAPLGMLGQLQPAPSADNSTSTDSAQ